MQIEFSAEFQSDLKSLKKRFRTLDTDLQTFIKIQIKLFHELKLDNQGIIEIAGLGIENPKIYKARKFACCSLKGTGSRSGIRIIYAHFPDLDKIEFIEIYYKGDKENEDRERIERKLKTLLKLD
ncbi:MAG TPA: hypothetical protein PLD62_11085 [Candidatus Cloacimonadota bacterium]|nr:hypothetical protein [Candidatus Cloacimonadota bacterium]